MTMVSAVFDADSLKLAVTGSYHQTANSQEVFCFSAAINTIRRGRYAWTPLDMAVGSSDPRFACSKDVEIIP